MHGYARDGLFNPERWGKQGIVIVIFAWIPGLETVSEQVFFFLLNGKQRISGEVQPCSIEVMSFYCIKNPASAAVMQHLLQ